MNVEFWKYFGMGLLGILLHITQKVMTKTNGHPNTFAEYFAQRQAETLYAVISYIIIIALWNSGEIFKIPAWLPFLGLDEIEPIPLSYWTALVGYFSSSIMAFLLYAASAVTETIKTKFPFTKSKE